MLLCTTCALHCWKLAWFPNTSDDESIRVRRAQRNDNPERFGKHCVNVVNGQYAHYRSVWGSTVLKITFFVIFVNGSIVSPDTGHIAANGCTSCPVATRVPFSPTITLYRSNLLIAGHSHIRFSPDTALHKTKTKGGCYPPGNPKEMNKSVLFWGKNIQCPTIKKKKLFAALT